MQHRTNFLAGKSTHHPAITAASLKLSDSLFSRFTARGIVALVFSCVTGILGVAVVAWYGMAPAVDEVPHAAAGIISQASPESLLTGREAHDESAAASGSGSSDQIAVAK